MNTVLAIGLGFIAAGFLLGALVGSRSRAEGARAGAAIGAYLGLMFGFPLLAIGLANT